MVFSHSSVHGHIDCFHLLAVINNAAMTIRIQVSVWTYVFVSLGYIHESIIAVSYGNFV